MDQAQIVENVSKIPQSGDLLKARRRSLEVRKERKGELDRPATVDSLLRQTKRYGIKKSRLENLVLGDMRKVKDLTWFVESNKSMTLRGLVNSIVEMT